MRNPQHWLTQFAATGQRHDAPPRRRVVLQIDRDLWDLIIDLTKDTQKSKPRLIHQLLAEGIWVLHEQQWQAQRRQELAKRRRERLRLLPPQTDPTSSTTATRSATRRSGGESRKD